MPEETPFKSVKITLSEEALTRLAELRKQGYYRSDSATIEECIRIVYDTAVDIAAIMARSRQREEKLVPVEIQAETLRGIGIRMKRFVPLPEQKKKALV